MLKVIGACAVGALAIGAIGAVGWLATENVYRLTAHFAPRYEEVRRTTFEQSRAYQEGTIRDLDNMRIEYARSASPEGKAAIADAVRHRLADVPVEQLPPSLREFADKVEMGQ